MFRPYVISAIASRNIKTFFTSVIGYLFIVVFVVVSGIIAFGPRFFADNLATLDQLTDAYPLLLLFLIPAITMGVWSDEKKQGTDAILFTLPASDLEILVGKYLSVVVVYLAALVFSLTQLVALASIGNPDWGVILSTYLGYFLSGIALLSIGMFASSLTSNTTVAFVLGALFCSIPVFIGTIAPGSQFLQSLSLSWQLREFGEGSVALSNLLYFVFLKNIGLFLNFVVMTKRHWSSTEESKLMGLYLAQTACILVIAGSLYFMASKAGNYYDTELDLTSQGVNTLDPTTIEVIRQASGNRLVSIQAFVSEDVPTDYVPVKKRLLRLLRQYAQMGGDRVELRIVTVNPNSKTEREARAAGLEGIDHSSEVGGRLIRQNVYMGLVFSSSIGESIIPQITPETPVEYELTRALGTTGVQQNKLRLGVLDTEAGYLGDSDGFQLNHLITNTLRKKYDVVRVSRSDLTNMIAQQKKESDPQSPEEKQAGDAKKSDADNQDEGKAVAADSEEDQSPKLIIPDVLLVVRPSRTGKDFQQEVLDFIDLGNPVCIMVDPINVFPWALLGGEPGSLPESPTQKLVSSAGGFNRVDEENNDCSTIFDGLNIRWHGVNQPATIPGTPPTPNRFGGPPQPGTPERSVTAFFPTVVSQAYRPFEELHFSDLSYEFLAPPEQNPVQLKIDTGPEREGIPVALGSPSTMMINLQNLAGRDLVIRDSVFTSGIENVLMFYAGAISPKTTDAVGNLKFDSLLSVDKDALGVSWGDVVSTETRDVPSFPPRKVDVNALNTNPNFYRFELGIQELDEEIADAEKEGRQDEVERLNGSKARLVREQKQYALKNTADVCFAAHISGQRIDKGGDVQAVVISDIDFATNLFGAVAEKLKRRPDNLPFLMNVIDTLGGRKEFVSLRGRNPVQRTLTYMENKREEFRSARLEKENSSRREYQREAAKIDAEREEKEAESTTTGFARIFQQLSAQQDDAKKKDIEKRKLTEKLDREIADLKSTEAQNVQETEASVRMKATIIPCLPALFLGIFVFIYRFVRERSPAGEQRQV